MEDKLKNECDLNKETNPKNQAGPLDSDVKPWSMSQFFVLTS